jgi:uncharacterized protein YbjT (DUF2867 family)
MLRLAVAIVSVSLTAPVLAEDTALVFGGTGRLGKLIVKRLLDAGYSVSVFVRPTSNRERLQSLDVAYVVGDLKDGEGMLAALGGRKFSFVIDASAKDRGEVGFYNRSMSNMLMALGDSEVQQFILHGSVGAGDNMKNFPDVPFGRMAATLKAKGEAEDMLRHSGITYTIIRNGLILRDGTPGTGTAELTEDDTVIANITREDLAALTMQCLNNPDCFDKTFHAIDPGLEAYPRN